MNEKEETSQNNALNSLNKVLKTSYLSLEITPLKDLQKYFIIQNSSKKQSAREKFWDSRIASSSEIITDLTFSNYSNLFPAKTHKFNLMREEKLGANLAPRTVEGHSHEGHSSFKGKQYGNTSLAHIISDDILSKFMSPKGKPYYGSGSLIEENYSGLINKSSLVSPREHYLSESQDYIDSVVHFLEDMVMSNNSSVSLRRYRSKELINSFIPSHISSVDPLAILRGSVFGGNFDNYEDIRKPAEDIFGINMGGGSEFLLDIDLAKKYGVHLDDLAHASFQDPILENLSPEKRIDVLKGLGVIQETKKVTFEGVNHWSDVTDQAVNIFQTNLIPVYIRTKKGSGVSDDAACSFVSLYDFNPLSFSRPAMWYDSLQRGSHLMDAVDTLEKASTYFFSEGQDQIISNYISHMWLQKVRENKQYKIKHNIHLPDLEKRIEHDGTTNFALFPKEELIDISAASANPVRLLNGSHIHSSARYFLQTEVFSSHTLDNNGHKRHSYDRTNVLAQEKIYMQKQLKKLNANVKENGKYLIPGKLFSSSLEIGFSQIPGNTVFNHFTKMIKKIANPKTRRKNLINHYSTKGN